MGACTCACNTFTRIRVRVEKLRSAAVYSNRQKQVSLYEFSVYITSQTWRGVIFICEGARLCARLHAIDCPLFSFRKTLLLQYDISPVVRFEKYINGISMDNLCEKKIFVECNIQLQLHFFFF